MCRVSFAREGVNHSAHRQYEFHSESHTLAEQHPTRETSQHFINRINVSASAEASCAKRAKCEIKKNKHQSFSHTVDNSREKHTLEGVWCLAASQPQE